MSSIGRIFIVLNLLLSAAFLGWAANALSTADGLEEQLATAKTEHAAALAELQEQNSALNIEVSTASDEQARFRAERDSEKSAAESLKTQLDEEKRRNDELAGQIAQIQATLNDYNDTIAQLSTDKDAALQRAHDAESEKVAAEQAAQAAEMAKRDAEELAQGAQATIASLQGQTSELSTQLSDSEAQLQTLAQLTGRNLNDIAAVPDIDAAVLDVNTSLSPGLVTLNVGTADGVKRGFAFDVFDGKSYKGQVRVENVQANLCSAIVISLMEGASISQGDRASTHL